MNAGRPWFQQGLRFTCTQCGNCCTGAPGYVWVSEAEEEGMARLLGLTPEAFRARYVREVGERRSLIEKANGDCVFLTEDRRCAVNEGKPRQCITFPFWPRILQDEASWELRSRDCPGMNRGGLFPREEIERLADPSTPRQWLIRIARRPRS